jgi:hypothetical protein
MSSIEFVAVRKAIAEPTRPLPIIEIKILSQNYLG